MSKYQVFAADKPEGTTVDEAREDLALRFPDYKVEVFERGQQYIAKLEKLAADDEEDGPKKDIPPFLEEKDDADDGDEDESNEPPKGPTNKKKDKAEEDELPEDGPPGAGDDSDDDGDEDDGDSDDKGGGDVGKALKALETLKSVLPHLEKQLKGLSGDDLGLPEGPPEGPIPGGPGGPVPPPGLPAGPPHTIGPTPGAPPGAAGIPPAPHPGLNVRKGPPVGVPTFGAKKDRFVFRPASNPDGSKVSFAEATEEVQQHPKYAAYDVHEMKYDDRSGQWVAHLKLREG